jgi:acyl-CoA synthetase (AMP-forming)/AMP-acid ligase II
VDAATSRHIGDRSTRIEDEANGLILVLLSEVSPRNLSAGNQRQPTTGCLQDRERSTFNRARPADDALPPAERAAKLSRGGAPAMGVRLRTDGSGEVVARGNVVLAGYWNNPEASAEALDDGWFHTGDGGRLDSEGHLTISDRKKDVIITRGENVPRSKSRTRSSVTRPWPRSP